MTAGRGRSGGSAEGAARATGAAPRSGRGSSDRVDAVVIGAGVNGLVCAAELARRGRRVVVVERAAHVGGAHATTELAPGFRADVGRHDVGWFPAKLARRLSLAGHGFRVAPGSASVLVVDEGAPALMLGEVGRTVETLRARGSPDDAARFPDFAGRMRPLMRFLESMYTHPAPALRGGSLGEMMELALAGGRLRVAGAVAVVDLLRTLPMPVADLLEDWFGDRALIAGIAASGVAGLHHGPRATGTAFLMLHREVGAPAGLFGARPAAAGGSGALAIACERAAREAGVRIRLESPVRRIVVERGAVTAVELATGETIGCRAAVSAVDPKRTFLEMVDADWLPPEFAEAVSHIRHRTALAVIRLALSELPRLADARGLESTPAFAGAVRVAGSLGSMERAADAVKYGEMSAEPMVELRVPSVHDPSLAPPGRHVATIHAQYAPVGLRGGWSSERRDAFADAAIARLAPHVPNLERSILHREVLAPPDLADRLGITEGDMDHGAIMLDQMLFMRPVPGWSRYRTPVAGLYLCSAGTHPGGGIPGVSGWLAAMTADA